MRREADQQVGVRITHEEGGLVDDEAECPDGRSSSEPGQDAFTHHGLDEKDEEGREEDRRTKEQPDRCATCFG